MPLSRKKIHHNSETELNDKNPTLDADAHGDISGYRTTFIPPMSLTVGQRVMQGAAAGDPECLAIRDSWRPALRILDLIPTEFDDLVNENPVVFNGCSDDLEEVN